MRKNGFTLIEVLIVMAIIGIMSAVVFASLSSGKEKKTVEGEARRVAAAIREIQNYALTGKQIGTNVSCEFGPGSITSLDTMLDFEYAYRTGASCSAGMSLPTSIPGMLLRLSNGVAFASDSNEFFFTVPRGELNPNGNATPINIRLNKGSTTHSVCIYPGGQVKDVSGAVCP